MDLIPFIGIQRTYIVSAYNYKAYSYRQRKTSYSGIMHRYIPFTLR